MVDTINSFEKYARVVTGSEEKEVREYGRVLYQSMENDDELFVDIIIVYHHSKMYMIKDVTFLETTSTLTVCLSDAYIEAYKDDFGPYAKSAMDGSLNKALDNVCDAMNKLLEQE